MLKTLTLTRQRPRSSLHVTSQLITREWTAIESSNAASLFPTAYLTWDAISRS